MSKRPQRDIESVITTGRRLIREAEQAIEEHERLLAENDINPRLTLQFVREHLGEDAAAAVQARVDEAIRKIEESIGRSPQVAVRETRAPVARARVRRSMI